ncbi:hypothetical protein [Mesobacillus jeotgali]|uniref:hypothetical protein n=1 Tax=Mesobacillus jeotgali TaxID=129985 RepID=UPI001F17CF0F|nr:hypothetical protein [Mesobacillus jeotgali]
MMNLPAADLGIMAEHLPTHEGVTEVKDIQGNCGQSGIKETNPVKYRDAKGACESDA